MHGTDGSGQTLHDEQRNGETDSIPDTSRLRKALSHCLVVEPVVDITLRQPSKNNFVQKRGRGLYGI
jgi:hypothetical protein